MLKNGLRMLSLSSVLVLASLLTTASASAAPQWVRNLTIVGVAETDSFVEINIVQSGTMQWVSVPISSSMAARFLSSAHAAWLAGKRLDVKVDFAAANGCGNLSNCENLLGWLIHD
jgi:hypothetical protein